ncbi:hypothetical protein HYFRA_00008148 [Hymenoscyphus fraxineus]|uniref:Uncharacterized protein n=1 Tax=Hymenoscyphus fraxineus TaxID=746836 RepID=A0A9N9L7B7_9HELO|nr:hypothetical protein HYFRA_00008148 [Hymenoscyphus fraxineus]
MFKPFKPPLRKSVQSVPKPTPDIDLTIPESDDEAESASKPPYKKRRLIHIVDDSPPPAKASTSSAVNAPRKPLLVVKNVTESKKATEGGLEGYYMVLWRKFTTKKNKTWDGDGVLAVYGGYARLQDISGRDMGRTMYNEPLLPGSTLSVGGKDIEIDSSITKADFMAGKPFLKASSKHMDTVEAENIVLPKPKLPKPESTFKPLKPSVIPEKKLEVKKEIPSKSFYASTSKGAGVATNFKNPLMKTSVMPQKKDGRATPRHDPDAPGALVMKRPKSCPKGKEIVDVVLDPFLAQHFRDHQREGVQFLYECVMGMKDFNGQGALLADEMGLGKTLQTIALIWTLLKQNPIHGQGGVIKKALIVCPVTLITNWKQEFQKWLGNERIGVLVADDKKVRLTDFTHGKSYSVIIIGYEKLRSVQDEMSRGAGIDLVVADEGHRLKTAQNKSAQAIKSLNTERRIILSGTPMQNDLSEFFEMVDFVNPGLLGSYKTFKKEFEGPITKSRQPDASQRDIEKGNARGEELAALTKEFILRRTSEVIAKYLPPKTEYVLFCNPTEAQLQVYQHVLQSSVFGSMLGNSESSLQLITLLKKVCNSPSLLLKSDTNVPMNAKMAELLEAIPPELLRRAPVKSSSKFRVLDQLIKYLAKNTTEKIVLVSNYTATLDVLGEHLTTLGLPFLRLDGSTPASRRQDLVTTFNKTPASKNFAFLLSAKSGGTGLNLIGASRLVLFDVDWNPAVDQQAMARIHRDGQKRPVKIYRFLMAGGMDEKIYQRQVTKMGLADSVVDGKKNESSFSPEELRDLFRLQINDGCRTHDLLGCNCMGLGAEPIPLPIEPESDEEQEDDAVEIEDSDDELLFPVNLSSSKIVSGTKANVSKIEQDILDEKNKTKGKKGMQALMQYQHIDTKIFRGETEDVFGFENEDFKDVKKILGDEALVDILKDESCKISFVFAKKA